MRNEKAKRFLQQMKPKAGVDFELHFPRADKGAIRLLRHMLAFDPAERPTAEEALADKYFTGRFLERRSVLLLLLLAMGSLSADEDALTLRSTAKYPVNNARARPS